MNDRQLLLPLNDTEPDLELDSEELRIILVGKTGAGKSETGNTILNGDQFKAEASPVSVTDKCQKQKGNHGDQEITVIDTPGIFGSQEENELTKQMKDCVMMSLPGPHVFLLVISIGRFTEEEQNAVKWIQENFGEDASLYTIILFTHTDQLNGTSLDEYLSKSKDLLKLVDSCGGRYYGFNNTERSNRTQVTELLRKIDIMLKNNGGKHYTNEMFKKAQREIRKKKIVKTSIVVVGVVAGGAAVVTGGVALVATEAVLLPALAVTGGAVCLGAEAKLMCDRFTKKKE